MAVATIPITIPTLQQLRDQIITDIESTRSTPLPAKSAWRGFATALAGVLVLVYRFGAWCYRQIFVSTCDQAALMLKGQDFDVDYQYATPAQIIATATGIDGSVIDTTRSYSAGGLIYQVQTAVTILLGSAQVSLKCLTPGTSGNLSSGVTLQATSPVVGVSDALIWGAAVVLGTDDQDIEDYRSQVKARLATPPQGGAVPDYIQWAREVPGVVAAFVARTVAGFVTVYPLVGVGASRLPNVAQQAAVLAYLQSPYRSILGCSSVSVAASTELSVVVTITGGLPSDTATKAAVQSAIQTHLWSRVPLQYPDEVPKNIISTANLTAIAIASGLQSGVVTMTVGGVTMTTRPLAIYELAALSGAVVWV